MSRGLDDLPDRAATLYLSDSMAEEDACTDVVTAAGNPDAVLWIGYGTSPADRVGAVLDADGPTPDRQAAILVGNVDDSELPVELSIDRIRDPGDVTGLGIAISERIDEWSGAEMTMCFDSLSMLLQYVSFDTVYEFVHVTTGRLYAHGASSHFHVDAGAHDEETLARLTTLFDARVERTDDDYRVRTE
ncbi:hypothetical protein BRD17_09410 [Halobacteriales archaeon SW_7_68_16]|nr:MAG: hypothetical protein BRD17_09410 [Halobacteriales archaeon SW_7_68_16]